VGSIPSSDSYGQRQPPGSVARKRGRLQHDEDGRQQDDAADASDEFLTDDDASDAAGEPIEDYYLPSDPSGDGE
jgi:hypothetical protein